MNWTRPQIAAWVATIEPAEPDIIATEGTHEATTPILYQQVALD